MEYKCEIYKEMKVRAVWIGIWTVVWTSIRVSKTEIKSRDFSRGLLNQTRIVSAEILEYHLSCLRGISDVPQWIAF